MDMKHADFSVTGEERVLFEANKKWTKADWKSQGYVSFYFL